MHVGNTGTTDPSLMPLVPPLFRGVQIRSDSYLFQVNIDCPQCCLHRKDI